MGGDHAPAAGRPHPCLALPSRPGASLPPELGVGGREVAAVGGDDGVEDLPSQPGRGTGGAELLDLPVAVEVFAGAETQRMRTVQNSSSRTGTSLVTSAVS